MITPYLPDWKNLFLISIGLINGLMTQSQDNDIVTDRPDQTEASATVGQGVLQIETGVVLSKENIEFYSGREQKTRDYATTLIRYGIFDNIEFRLVTAVTDYEETLTTRKTGFQPLTIGTKISILSEKGWRPEVAFIGHITLPGIGDENLRPEYVAPDFRFSLSHTLSERFSLGYNVGFAWDGVHPRSSFIYTFALGASIAGPVSAFVEVFGEGPEGLGLIHNADFGFTLLVTPDLQFDTSYGFALDSGMRSFFNAGVSLRFGAE